MDELDAIVNISRNGVIFTNEKGIIKVFNESFINILDLKGNLQGISVDEVFKKALKEF